MPKAIYSQFGNSVVTPGDIPDAEHIPNPAERMFVPRILVETDRAHEAAAQSAVFPLLDLEHQTSIAIKESGDVRQCRSGSTSHGIVSGKALVLK
ncbi:MAG: hypothetical protein AAB591_01185 [Patescibacteria group bacterium]